MFVVVEADWRFVLVSDWKFVLAKAGGFVLVEAGRFVLVEAGRFVFVDVWRLIGSVDEPKGVVSKDSVAGIETSLLNNSSNDGNR